VTAVHELQQEEADLVVIVVVRDERSSPKTHVVELFFRKFHTYEFDVRTLAERGFEHDPASIV
jgi:hypothetical protein